VAEKPEKPCLLTTPWNPFPLETPVNLTARQKELLTELQDSLDGKKHSPKSNGWFDGVKKFFGEN